MNKQVIEYLNKLFIKETKDIIIETLPNSQVKDLIPIFKRFNKSQSDASNFKYKDKPFNKRIKQILDKEHLILVAKDNDNIIGVIAGVTKLSPTGQIDLLYIDPPYRGTGLADKLFSQTVEWLKSKQRPVIRVGVLGGNDMARKFYSKMGFIEDTIQMRNKESKNIVYDIL